MTGRIRFTSLKHAAHHKFQTTGSVDFPVHDKYRIVKDMDWKVDAPTSFLGRALAFTKIESTVVAIVSSLFACWDLSIGK